jgi:hypothetical protein
VIREAASHDRDGKRWVEFKARPQVNTIGDPAQYRTDNSAAFGSWQTWCAAAGEPAGNRKALFEQLEGRGFKRFSSHGKRGFVGFTIKQQDQSGAYWNH